MYYSKRTHTHTQIYIYMLRENEFCILINLQRRKHTYLHYSVSAKKEIKLEYN